MTIGDRFSEIRKNLRFNQSELARSIDANPSIISDIERGEKEPSKKIISALIIKYKINSNWLLTGDGDMYIQSVQPPKSLLEQGLDETITAHPKISEIESRLSAIETLLKQEKPSPAPSEQSKPAANEGPLYTAENEPEYDEEDEEREYIPYVHEIAAGPPITQNDDPSETVAVPAHLMKQGRQYYAASIRGDSMTEAGIRNGDMILIRYTDTPRDGAIQVVRYQNKSTLKLLREIEGGGWELHYRDGSGRIITCDSAEYETQGEFEAILPRRAVPKTQ